MASQKETQLQNALLDVFNTSPQLLNIPSNLRPILNEAVRRSIEQRTPELINTVETQSNQQINDIPNNLIGINNPVDVVGSNLSTTQLNDVIGTSISSDVTNQFSSKISTDIIDTLSLLLPPTASSRINLDLIKNGIQLASLNSAELGVTRSIDEYSQQTLSGSNVPPPIVPDIDSFFSANPNTAFAQIEEQFDSSIAGEAFSAARQFNTNSSENQDKLITQTIGFIDPSATFPTKEYAGISEVSKLAQGEVNGTIVQKKEKERTIGIQLPNNESWEQPTSSFKGEYPYNKVMETESGHVIELDDTPGCERIQIYHRSGTFVEIDSNGSVIKRTKGSSYEIIDRNGYISVTGDANLSVKGSIKIFVGGNADIEVEGDTNVKCLNDITVQAAGKLDLSATEEINIHSGNVNIEADFDLNIKSNRDSFYASGRELHNKANATIFHQAVESFNIKTGVDVNIDTDGKAYVNSGTASDSKFSKSSNTGTIGLRKDIVIEKITDPTAPNFLDKFGYDIEDSEFEEEAIQRQKQFRQRGILTDDELNETSVEINRDSPVSRNSDIILPSDFVLKQTYLPDNFQLSNNFTLAKLSSRAVVTNNPVTAQLGVSYGEIVYNLQGIALNICEPILALYPNMFVTSAFRLTNNSASTSDHPRGKAVDIQFRNVSKEDYFDIAKKLATFLNYDKLLLEYKTYGTGLPWIHISFDINQQRKIVLTYLNDKKFGDGLVSLA